MNSSKFSSGLDERQKVREMIAGERAADQLIENGHLVNVSTGEILKRDVAIVGGRVGTVGRNLESYRGEETEVIDARGLYLTPGFIDAHLHIESSMLSPTRFAELMAEKGVTTVFFDPHEIANVAGLSGVKWMVKEIGKTPLNGFLTVPSCIPASLDRLETTGAKFGIEEIREALGWEAAVALGEMMNFPGILNGDKATVKKLQETLARKLPVEGHASGLVGEELDVYGSMGIDSDHEAVTKGEGIERARKGFWTYVREGSGWADLGRVIKALTETDISSRRFCLVIDDRDPVDLTKEGGVDHVIRRAIEEGLDPVEAITMASLNPATRFGLDAELGSISPGRKADINLISDLESLQVEETLLGGKRTEEVTWPPTSASSLTETVQVKGGINPDLFELREKEKRFGIRVHNDDILTEKLDLRGLGEEKQHLDSCAVIERHNSTGNVGRAMVEGFDLRAGAVASTVAHDSHNLIVLGKNEDDMATAGRHLLSTGGGQVVVEDGVVKAGVELPIAGLMTASAPREVASSLRKLKAAIEEIGCNISQPLMILSSLALAVIPEVRLTDKGFVDVNRQEVID